MNDNGIFRAEQRVKEMNRMAQQYVRQGNNYMNSASRQQVQPRFEPVHKPDAPPARTYERTPDAPAPLPPKQEPYRPLFGLDNEKLLIILIMYLLIKEKADIKLIAALGYLLL